MTYDDIEAWVGFATVILAVVAVFISVRTEMRSQSRWKADHDREREVATANARPLLSISGLGYEDRRGLRLTNDGIGPALVTNVSISNGGRTGNTVADVVNLGHRVVWNTFRRFRPPFQPVGVGQERTIIELTAAGLRDKEIQPREFSDAEISEIMRKLKDELAVVQIQITYTDIFGNVQSPCNWNADDEVRPTV